MLIKPIFKYKCNQKEFFKFHVTSLISALRQI